MLTNWAQTTPPGCHVQAVGKASEIGVQFQAAVIHRDRGGFEFIIPGDLFQVHGEILSNGDSAVTTSVFCAVFIINDPAYLGDVQAGFIQLLGFDDLAHADITGGSMARINTVVRYVAVLQAPVTHAFAAAEALHFFDNFGILDGVPVVLQDR
jgi:hypothetical protein